MAIGEDGDALLLRTWRASHDWKERPPLDAQGREPTWWQPGTAEQHGAAEEAEGVRLEQPRQLVPAGEYNPWRRLHVVRARKKKREKRLRQRAQRNKINF